MDVSEKFHGYAKLSIQSMTENLLPLKHKSEHGGKNATRKSKSQTKVKVDSDRKFTTFDDSAVPVDHRSKIYVAFILSGIGYMLPYTCFIVAVDYYQDRFPHTTIIFDMTTATILAGTVGVIINNALVETLSLMWRVMVGYVMSTVLLLFLTVFDVTLDIFRHDTAYWVTLMSVAVMSVGCAVQQSSFYGYANMLPRRYTQAVMVGESFAGVLVSINRIITKLLVRDETTNTTIFFVVSILCIGVCCLTFVMARHTPFVQHHLYLCRADNLRQNSQEATELKLTQVQFASYEFEVAPRQVIHTHDIHTQGNHTQDNHTQDNHTHTTLMPTAGDRRNVPPPKGSEVPTNDMLKTDSHIGQVRGKASEEIPVSFKSRGSVMYGSSRSKEGGSSRASLVVDGQTNFKARLRARWEVTKQIYPFMASFGLTFYVSVSLYPGIISEIVSCRLGTWMPVLLMACFNLSDALGKTLTSIKHNYSKLRLFLCSLARICLIPFVIMFCEPRLDPSLHGEFWPILVTLALGATNGYFGSLPLVLAPSQVAPRHRELCGNTMMVSFTFGIICGAFTSYGLDLFIGPHPGFEHCNSLGANMSSLIPNMTDRTVT